jgi:hypothetical protein
MYDTSTKAADNIGFDREKPSEGTDPYAPEEASETGCDGSRKSSD